MQDTAITRPGLAAPPAGPPSPAERHAAEAVSALGVAHDEGPASYAAVSAVVQALLAGAARTGEAADEAGLIAIAVTETGDEVTGALDDVRHELVTMSQIMFAALPWWKRRRLHRAWNRDIGFGPGESAGLPGDEDNDDDVAGECPR